MKKKILSIFMGCVFIVTPIGMQKCILTTKQVVQAASYESWSANKVYNTGDIVYYNGANWEARWYTFNEAPGTTGEWGVWQKTEDAISSSDSTESDTSYLAWDSQTVYNSGDIVSYNNTYWIARWYSMGDTPGTTGEYGVWEEYTEIVSSETPVSESVPVSSEAASSSPIVPEPSPAVSAESSPSPSCESSVIPSKDMAEVATEYMNQIDITNDCPVEAYTQQVNVTYGSVIYKTYYSTTTNSERGVNIILPANYSSEKKYPVLYLMHGIFQDENSLLSDTSAGIVQVSGNLMSQEKAKDMIIVLPNIYAQAKENVTVGFNQDTIDGYDNFINDLTNDLMPYMEENYSILTGRENTAIAGFSMGGREALYIGVSRPDLFAYVLAISPAPGITPAVDWAYTHPGLMSENEFKYKDSNYTPYVTMICCGTNDSVVGTFPKTYHEILTTNNVPHIWFEVPDADHNGQAIRTGLYNFLPSLFKAN